MKSERKIAAVTGAANGIGLGVAARLARAGYHVLAVDRSDAVVGEVERLRTEGFTMEPVVLDVTNEAGVRELVANTMARHGRWDVLVNNAGIHPKYAGGRNAFGEIPTSQWDKVVAVNLTATFVWCREVLPAMRAGKWGRIINMSSRAGRTLVDTAGAHYAATKAGIIGLTRVLAAEVAKDGITANCIAPGRIETPMTQQGSEALRAELVGRIPVGRIGVPSEIGHVVEFLASEESGYITGAVLDINGGTFMP